MDFRRNVIEYPSVTINKPNALKRSSTRTKPQARRHIKIGNEVRIERSAYRQYLENRKTVTPLVGQQRLEAVD